MWVNSIELNIKSMLEVGCGYGQYAQIYKHLDYHGIDVNRQAISYLKKLHGHHNFYAEDFGEKKFNRTFDLVFAIQTIEHMRDPDKVIQKCIDLADKYFYFCFHTGMNHTKEHKTKEYDTYIEQFLSTKILKKLFAGHRYNLEPFDYGGAYSPGLIVKGEKFVN